MSKNKKFNSNIKGIKTSFDANSLTNYSGAYPVYKFIMKLGLINKLDDINIQLHHNIQYTIYNRSVNISSIAWTNKWNEQSNQNRRIYIRPINTNYIAIRW